MNKKGIIVAAALVVALASVGTVSAFAASAGGTTAWNASPSFDNCETLSYSEGAANCYKLSGDIVESANMGKAVALEGKECVIADSSTVKLSFANSDEAVNAEGQTVTGKRSDEAAKYSNKGEAVALEGKECVIVDSSVVGLFTANGDKAVAEEGKTTTGKSTRETVPSANMGELVVVEGAECVIVDGSEVALFTTDGKVTNSNGFVTGKAPN